MDGKTTVVLITANVGSIFEEPSIMLKIWSQEFLTTISQLNPKFVALHCQEVGGKNYEKSMQHVEDFVGLLVNSDELRLFDKARIYLDEDYSSAENFTALGNFYFVHESITDILIFDFEQRRFVEVEGKAIYSKNIESVRTKEKSKFPLEYFPECKWSRKGFLRTRWCMNGTIFDLVNIHLFHDVSNFVAIKSFPSVYSDTRRRALAYTLERFQTDEYGPVPLFLFGDFNFRTDTKGVVKHLSEGLKSSSQGDEVSIIQFKEKDKVVLSLGKKEFSHSNHQEIFTIKQGDWLRKFDKELEAFSDQLFEFDISFPPSYPFEENSSGDKCYMKTRCPAWCDRVILSYSAIPLVKDSNEPESVVYGLMGRSTCMGDHKPVYLKFVIKSDIAKEKWLDSYFTSKFENQERMINGLLANSNSGSNHDSEKTLRTGMKYSELEIEKLACSLEALMSQNSSFSREMESNIEPDLSRCSSCLIHQHVGRVVNNPGGEEVSKENLIVDDKKIIALLASEIKVPADILQKIDIHDTGQKGEKETCSWEFKSNDDKFERFAAVKRVNSASLVEHSPKKEDWKNSRCNSDVSWSPSTSVQNQNLAKSWKNSKQFNRGNSRIRLISSSNSLSTSLPRLTSHHSSSDEDWFEEVEEGEDDVLRMNDDRSEAHEEGLSMCPDDCGDKGAIAKSVKPATESESRTNIFIGENSARITRRPSRTVEESSSDTTTCAIVDSLREPDFSLAGKSFDKIILSDKSKSKPKHRIHADKEIKPDSKINKSKPLGILKRLTEGRKESHNSEFQSEPLAGSSNRESFENLIVDPAISEKPMPSALEKFDATETECEEKLEQPQNCRIYSNQIGDAKKKEGKNDIAVTASTESWETIELGAKKEKETEKELEKNTNPDFHSKQIAKKKCAQGDGTNCCCILQ